ncbi:hypothetical protein VIGAN_06000400 [Vigna angularis var. angularis]|nr:hypothetical protein VIGAN_06000400 [Vigna angularis var. angularis]
MNDRSVWAPEVLNVCLPACKVRHGQSESEMENMCRPGCERASSKQWEAKSKSFRTYSPLSAPTLIFVSEENLSLLLLSSFLCTFSLRKHPRFFFFFFF